jgi:hypothetical protein
MENLNNTSYEKIFLTNVEKGYFDPMRITKYFKNQIPNLPGEKEVFVDKEFLPDRNSILSPNSIGHGFTKELESMIDLIEFKRADDIFGKDWEIFEGKIEVDDVKQGHIGNCHFLSAVASLVAVNPNLIYQLFRTRTQSHFSEKNYFEVVLFIEGVWQVVIIDDWFISYKEQEKYLHDSEFPFTRPNKKELWVLILEKAWAKVLGGYSKMIGGNAAEVFKTLTGFDTESMYFKCPVKFKKNEEVWTMLNEYFTKGYALCSSVQNISEAKELGLIFEHSYSLTSAKEGNFNGEQIRLVHIRNPWGKGEWKGRYSDNDTTNWTEEKKKYFGFEATKDDGSFFMHFDDYYKYWGYLFVCKIKSNMKVKSFSIPPMEKPLGSIFLFHFREDVTVEINTKIQPSKVINGDCAGNIIYAAYDKKKQISETGGVLVYISDVTNTINFKKGFHVIWIYQHSPNIPMEVTFAVNKDFRVEYTGYDEQFHLIREIFGQGYVQNQNDFVEEIKKKNSHTKAADIFFWTFRNCHPTFPGLSYFICKGYKGNEAKNWQFKLSCDDKDFGLIFPPYNKEPSYEFIYSTKKNKKPFVILGQFYSDQNSNFSPVALEETTDEPTVIDSIEYEKYLSFEVQHHDISHKYYDYIL